LYFVFVVFVVVEGLMQPAKGSAMISPAIRDAMTQETLAPVLRVRDAEAAIAWYQRLGFALEFEHSAGPNFGQTTAAVRRGQLVLILSNRDEDTPASQAVVFLRVADVAPIAHEFDVPIENLQAGAMIGRHIELHDPDGNRIRVGDVAPAPTPWSDLKARTGED
jgi:catechol 2,3-dioxygenase-like lactoylglutathione lyase family enzyme